MATSLIAVAAVGVMQSVSAAEVMWVVYHAVHETIRSSVVGLNDNHLPLTEEQTNLVDNKAILMEEYNNV